MCCKCAVYQEEKSGDKTEMPYANMQLRPNRSFM